MLEAKKKIHSEILTINLSSTAKMKFNNATLKVDIQFMLKDFQT